VHELTGSGLAVSALFATTLLPMVALAPLAGWAADRCESVRVIVVASLAQAVVAAALRARRPPSPGRAGKRQRAGDGFRLLRGDRVLKLTIGAAVGALLFISAALTVEIFYLKDVVGASDTMYALLVCGWMVGMVVAATALAPRVPAPAIAAGALLAVAAQGAGMGGQTVWAVLPVAFAGYLVGGLAHGAKNVLLRTLLTVRVPDAMHGRAFAA
jgi:hypothetical protein